MEKQTYKSSAGFAPILYRGINRHFCCISDDDEDTALDSLQTVYQFFHSVTQNKHESCENDDPQSHRDISEMIYDRIELYQEGSVEQEERKRYKSAKIDKSGPVAVC